MKLILTPLIAIGIFATTFSSIAAAAGAGANDKKGNQAPLSTLGMTEKLPVGTVYAFWPNHKEGEDKKVITITGDDDASSSTYVAIFKDPKNNKFDLSDENAMTEALASEEEAMASNSVHAMDMSNMDNRVLFSVCLDEDDNVLYSVPGTNVPTSWRDVRNMNDIIASAMISKLDPNTPGIEDIKDPSAAMAQLILNNIAMQGPHALEEAKKNPALVETLDNAYEASQNWEDIVAELDERVAEEDEQRKGQNVPIKTEKKSIRQGQAPQQTASEPAAPSSQEASKKSNHKN
ncbi:hypothetical protein BGX26_001276 [Mortierella sp. AD094]|nr:hypothetical protein BGX26_001276 [Mortierella sp. AD094]